MELLRDFKKISKNDVSLAGGKGASLGEMTKAGIPVPHGFVILSTAFEKFLEETDLNIEIEAIIDSVNQKEIHTVEHASEKIEALILKAEMPEDIKKEIQKFFKNLGAGYVAVRSSATAEDSASAAWAGQLESYLNTTEETLLGNVKKCWASLFTSRAIFYRFEKGLHKQKISVAVVVQKMVESEKSGITFSVHPVTEDKNQLIIEAGLGLGEAIVSGQITPDSYVVEKQPRRIIDKNVQSQIKGLYRAKNGGNEWRKISIEQGRNQVLSDKEILEFSEIVLRIENHYSFPCDIEWAFENGKFYIVQSRPITTLSNKPTHNPQTYAKFFTRDFSLPAIEVWYRGETIMPKQWTEEKQPCLPYIVFERADDTVACYYNQKGVDWETDLLLDIAKKDKSFVPELCKIIPEKLKFLRPLYENPVAISHSDLVRFLKELESYYPWFEAMWWLMELTPERLGDLNVDELREVRKQTNDLSVGTDIVIRMSCQKLFPKIKDFVHVLTVKEIISKKIPDLSELKKRDLGFLYTDDQLFVGVSREEIENKYDIALEKLQIDSGTEEFKGLPVYKGVVRGKVKRVMGHKQISEIKEGEILVSPMTMPDFLPAMKKASAFITDEGGITCHASIMAREMKKPCIVGTKIATQILKDGDEIKIDGNTGIIKILNRINKIDVRFKKDDYMLSFWVQGVSVFVTDIHLDAYKILEVLYVIDNGMFKQYFTKKAYEQALDRGLEFYSDKHAFDKYQKDLSSHCDKFKEFFESEIKNQKTLSQDKVIKFFEYTKKLCGDYAQMNFESTDKAFAQQEKNPIIKKNLSGVAKFKDTVRAVMNMVLFEPNGYLNQFFAILGKQFDILPSIFDNLTQKEILDLFEGKKPIESIVAKRQEAFVESYNLGSFYEGKEAEFIIQEFKESVEYSDVFQGQVASKGKVTGTVKIIPVDYSNLDRVNTEIEKMKHGDILVAETTAPELIVACKKAGAIVTDMGGLMSHAAIVSREFGIPCVVGTKNASKILKDGDRVEVDGILGVVKVLK